MYRVRGFAGVGFESVCGAKVNEKGVAGLDSPAVPVWLPSAVFALSLPLPLRLLPERERECVCVRERVRHDWKLSVGVRVNCVGV